MCVCGTQSSRSVVRSSGRSFVRPFGRSFVRSGLDKSNYSYVIIIAIEEEKSYRRNQNVKFRNDDHQ